LVEALAAERVRRRGSKDRAMRAWTAHTVVARRR